MSGVATAIIGSAIIGGVVAHKSGQQAADAQTKAATDANAEARYEFDQNQQRLAPWMKTGGQALGSLAYGMGLDNSQPGQGGAPLDFNGWLQSQGIPTAAPTAGPARTGVTVDQNGNPVPSAPPGYQRSVGGMSASGPGAQIGAVPIRNVASLRAGPRGGDGGGDGAPPVPSPGMPNNLGDDGRPGSGRSGGPPDPKAMADYQNYLKTFKPAPGTAGASGYGDLNRDFTLADFNKDPGYQFRLQQGMDSLEHGASARGGLLSGAAIKGAIEYGQGFGSNEYSSAYNRFNNDRTQRFNRLSAVAGTGQTATTSVNADATSLGQTIGGNYNAIGNARGAAAINTGNAINNGVSSIGNYFLQQQYMNRFAPPPAPSTVSTSGPGPTRPGI